MRIRRAVSLLSVVTVLNCTLKLQTQTFANFCTQVTSDYELKTDIKDIICWSYLPKPARDILKLDPKQDFTLEIPELNEQAVIDRQRFMMHLTRYWPLSQADGIRSFDAGPDENGKNLEEAVLMRLAPGVYIPKQQPDDARPVQLFWRQEVLNQLPVLPLKSCLSQTIEKQTKRARVNEASPTMSEALDAQPGTPPRAMRDFTLVDRAAYLATSCNASLGTLLSLLWEEEFLIQARTQCWDYETNPVVRHQLGQRAIAVQALRGQIEQKTTSDWQLAFNRAKCKNYTDQDAEQYATRTIEKSKTSVLEEGQGLSPAPDCTQRTHKTEGVVLPKEGYALDPSHSVTVVCADGSLVNVSMYDLHAADLALAEERAKSNQLALEDPQDDNEPPFTKDIVASEAQLWQLIHRGLELVGEEAPSPKLPTAEALDSDYDDESGVVFRLGGFFAFTDRIVREEYRDDLPLF